MHPTALQPGITFAVDAVTPAAAPLPVCRTHEALRATLGDFESCSDYHGAVVRKVYGHPLLAAVHLAFSEHRPLVLTPDAVWITIAQGVAHHMTVHGERLRSRFVTHPGKLDLVFECRDWVEGSPENPWPDAFASWASQIRDHVGAGVHDTLLCDFSTSGPVERAASRIVILDVFERYFHYLLYCICGIPAVTLTGTPADWQRLADKAAALAVFDLDWWLEHLRPVCAQFVRASRGDVDPGHWQAIYKPRRTYGGDVINGWIAKLFPYIRPFVGGPCSRRNPIFETGEGFQSLVAPGGLSQVPFTWRDLRTGRGRRMEAVGGLLGVAQDADTLALRPTVGWVVRAAPKLDVLLERLAAEHTTFAGRRGEGGSGGPEDLEAFYHRTDGAELFGRGASAAYRIVPAAEREPLDWGEHPERRHSCGPGGRIWHRLAWLADGSWLAMNLDANIHNAVARDPALYERYHEEQRRHHCFGPVCHGSARTQGRPGENPVVALSFTELLERLLDSGGRPFWLDSPFTGYGDAEAFTRRDDGVPPG